MFLLVLAEVIRSIGKISRGDVTQTYTWWMCGIRPAWSNIIEQGEHKYKELGFKLKFLMTGMTGRLHCWFWLAPGSLPECFICKTLLGIPLSCSVVFCHKKANIQQGGLDSHGTASEDFQGMYVGDAPTDI